MTGKRGTGALLAILTAAVVFYVAVQNLHTVLVALGWLYRILGTVIAGLCIAFVLNTLLRVVEGRMLKKMGEKRPFLLRLKRPLAIFLMLLIAFGIVATLLLVLIPRVVDQMLDLAYKLPDYLASAITWAEGLLGRFEQGRKILEAISGGMGSFTDGLISFLSGLDGSSILGTATSATTGLISSVGNTVLALILAVYILAQKERIGLFMRRLLYAILPRRGAEHTLEVCRLSDKIFSNFIIGQLTEAIILGVLCYIGMRIFRFPYPEIISVLIAVTALVPVVGPIVGSICGGILILLVDPLKAVLFVVFILVLQQIDNAVIYPRIMGKSVGLPGILVLCAVLVGGEMGGALGTLISVPVAAVLYTLLKQFVEGRLQKKEGLVPELGWTPRQPAQSGLFARLRRKKKAQTPQEPEDPE